jgi:hypothetical protein
LPLPSQRGYDVKGEAVAKWISFWWAVILAFLVTPAPTAHAAGTEYPVAGELSRTEIMQINWQHPEASALWKQLGLPTQASVKDQPVTLYGQTFNAVWGGGVLHLESKDQPTCEGILPKMKTQFGKPIEDDGSIVIPLSETQNMKMLFLMYQWDVGHTRLGLMCAGNASTPALPDSPDKASWSFAIAPIEGGLKTIVPRFALRCTRTVSYTDGTTHSASDLAIWVDPTMQHITNPDQSVIADNGSVVTTDSRISFTVTREKIKSDYAIDRYTGALTAAITQDNRTAGRISGNCEKASALNQKF